MRNSRFRGNQYARVTTDFIMLLTELSLCLQSENVPGPSKILISIRQPLHVNFSEKSNIKKASIFILRLMYPFYS